MTPLAALGAQVRVARLARGWTQERLAARAGYHVQTVVALEHGENVTIIAVVDVLQTLGMTLVIDRLPRSRTVKTRAA